MTRTFWISLFIAFTNSLSFTILIPILYLYGREFGLSDFQTGLLFATYSGAQFIATPIIGKLSDRFGRKPLLIICLTGTVFANFLAGTASSAAVLFFARFLDGITGGNVSVTQAIVSDVTPPEQRAKAFGLFGAVTFGLGFILGPILSLISQQYSLGAGFLASSAIASIALALTLTALPETLKTKSANAGRWFDLGLGNLLTGLSMPKVGILLIINFLIGTTFTIFTFAFQPYYINVLGQDSKSLTLLFVGFGTISVLMQSKGLSLMTQHLSLVKILFLGLLGRSLSILLMPTFANIVYFVAVCLLFSAFNSLVQPMITTLISLNAKPEIQGMAMGLNASYLNVSNAFGPVIAGLIVNQAYPATYAYPLYLAGGLTFGVLTFAMLTRQQYASASQKS
ncbi:MAG: MFS transporter [Thermosynechococcaceae cyanobacterium MS004]|nr:MFS transporter [Thermosynechococcaceae cyanobacterium MS004]